MARVELVDLIGFYHPNVGRGNFQADVARRGENRMLRKVILKLGLATEEEIDAEFRRLDGDDWDRSEAAIRRMEAREAERARS